MPTPIPDLLIHPPWRKSEKAQEPRASAEPVALPAPALRWNDGERERFRGPEVKLFSAPADERLFDRLLDQLDRRRPIPLADVRRLSDEWLHELGHELRTDAVDCATLQLMIARLGEPFVERAIEIVKASPPEKGLFPAMAPVAAASLAPLAAAPLMARKLEAKEASARPFVPTSTEQWLERHAATAVLGLLSDALDERAKGHARARLGMTWIAVRTGTTTGVAALDDELAPYRLLAPLCVQEELRWFCAFAALGLDRLALELLERHAVAEAVPWVARAARTSARDVAVAWLERHRDVALAALSGIESHDARAALEVLAGNRGAGDPAVGDVPEVVPPLPAWLHVSELPSVRLKDGTPLPDDAALALLEMLRFTSLSRPYRGVDQVRAACDEASLDGLACALMRLWKEHGQEPRDRWALDAGGAIGGDGCASEVGSSVRSWARAARPPERGWDADARRVVTFEEGDRNWNYALRGCEVLRAIGSELALTALDDVARHGPQAWVRRHAKTTLGDLLERKPLRERA
ncbi:MAG: hypothetical protein ACOC1F_11205, partial [Myxococcota bacterium]